MGVHPGCPVFDCCSIACGHRDRCGRNNLCRKSRICVWSLVCWSCCAPFCRPLFLLLHSPASLPLTWGVGSHPTWPQEEKNESTNRHASFWRLASERHTKSVHQITEISSWWQWGLESTRGRFLIGSDPIQTQSWEIISLVSEKVAYIIIYIDW